MTPTPGLLPILAETAIIPTISTVVLFAFFIGILLWLILAGRDGRYARDARLPLDDSTAAGSTSGAGQKDHDHGH
jgi:cbb3-type cytochrome oxidase subunit 3